MPAVYSTDIVVFDLEASSPDEGDNEVTKSNIIEIGAVRLDRKELTVKGTFSELVRPRDYPVPPYITELTGITPEMVAERAEFGAVGRDFTRWYGPRNRAILAAFGIYYDMPLLRKECREFGIPFSDHFVGGALDVRSLAVAWLAERGRSTTGVTLKGVLARMGMGDLQLSTHRALDDARATAAVLQVFHFGEVRL